MFVALGLSGVIPVVHGLVLDGLGTVDQRMGLRYVLVEAALYISGAGLYVVSLRKTTPPSDRLS
jgi:adiponectin receptor